MTGVQWAKARLASRLVRIAIVVALVVGAAVYATVSLVGGGQVTASAIFSEAKNIYPGDSVEILGVKVGSIDSLTPVSGGVRVTFHYSSQYKVPANAEAVIVSPVLVSDRYLELTPAYTGGTALASGAVIPQNRTAVPVEWDQTMNQLNQLVTALGPGGANKNGAVNRLLGTASKFEGEGQLLHDTMQKVAAAAQTLSGGSQNLFGNVRNLQLFTTALEASDTEITQFIDRLNSVSGTLNGDRGDLTSALSQLDAAAPVVTNFISQNKTAITSATANTAEIARLISSERLALENALHVAPTLLSDFYYIYDPLGGSLTGALNVPNLKNPAQLVCSGIGAAAGVSSAQAATRLCQTTLGPLLNLLQINYPPVSVNPLQRPGAPTEPSTGTGPSGSSTSKNPLSQLLNPLGGL